jgi:hypothetical protein
MNYVNFFIIEKLCHYNNSLKYESLCDRAILSNMNGDRLEASQ